MDIKTRIDALTEAEAKAALEWTLERFPDSMVRCEHNCPISNRCFAYITAGDSDCKNLLLDEALKEARK